jgi:hypothetical protein
LEDQNKLRIDTLTGGVNIVRYIKAQRLRWFGHIQRMEDDNMVKKLTNWKPFGKRPAGRSKNRWNPKRYGSAQGEELEGVD